MAVEQKRATCLVPYAGHATMRAMLVEALGGTAACAAGVLTYAVRGRSSRLFGPSVYRGPKDRRSVALTFDDGPSESTPRLLELLAEWGAPATFFLCGANVRRLPATARSIAGAGHEIGNHSDTHPAFYLRSKAFIFRELEAAQETIAEHAGRRPRLFRAPYGARWFGLREAQGKLGLLGVMWTVLGRDWRLPAVRIAERILRHASNGAIVCLHDGWKLARNPNISETLEAVRLLIPRLRERGIRLETVSGLLWPKN